MHEGGEPHDFAGQWVQGEVGNGPETDADVQRYLEEKKKSDMESMAFNYIEDYYDVAPEFITATLERIERYAAGEPIEENILEKMKNGRGFWSDFDGFTPEDFKFFLEETKKRLDAKKEGR